MRFILFLILAFAALPIARAEDSGASSAEAAIDLSDLQKAIPHYISLLEKQDYLAFVKASIPPEELTKKLRGRTLAEFAAGFGQKQSPRLLAILKATKGVQGTTDKSGDLVTYRIPEATSPPNSEPSAEITFIRVEKHWYVKNFAGIKN